MRDATIATCGNRRPATGRTVRVGRFAAGALLGGACLLAVACTTEAPREVALGDDIEVGPYTLSVLRARNAPDPPPPLSTFRTRPGKKGIVVFVYWKRLGGDLDGQRRWLFIESFFEMQLSVVDAAGRRTEVSGVLPERLFHMEEPGPNWRDWVVVFHVRDESRGLTLLVENPEPRRGQVRVTAVPLGM
jgi:hypothetical protein